MAGIDGIDIDAIVKDLKAKRAEMTELIRKIDHALEALTEFDVSPTRKAGKSRPGGRGRPPKAYRKKLERADAPSKKPLKRKSRKGRRKKPPTEKQLAAMAKAREALAAKRAAAAAS